MTGAGQPRPSVHLRSRLVLEHSGVSGQTPRVPALPPRPEACWLGLGCQSPEKPRPRS